MNMLYVAESKIEGKGLFTDSPIARGKLIGEVFQIHIKRWVNHSRDANTTIIIRNGKKILQAIRPIVANEELTTDYRNPLNPWKGQYDFEL
jgi:SET domain-containing protein